MNTSSDAINIDEVLAELSNCTVLHPGFQEAMRITNKCIITTRDRKDPSSAMLIGPTGVGKTRLCQIIEKQLGPIHTVQRADCEKTIRPCVYVELPASATIKSLSMVMAQTLGARPNDYQSVTALETLIIARLITMEVKLVILDDFHHVAQKGLSKTKDSLCNWIIKLLNKSGIPFLLSGTTASETTINMAEELSDRFPYRARLEPLPMIEKSSASAFLGVVARLQQEMIRLGCLRSYIHLTDHNHYTSIYLATQGNFRRLSDLLHDSFRIALLRGDHSLTIDDFADAADDLAFCCRPNYFRMTPRQLNSALKVPTIKLKKK
ncbi:TniB family NTP-binding protein [Pseudomonas sp. BF-B-28]|uniref:TniB family NTP-binding protein n=1 Tax=Pseudomonas sp. BF-B-28 TaxID=2832353 RepID=UPI001CC156D0|nr:TniB family NTP-binding protein [Pseudomonas sp. BF-B-28]